LVLTGELSLNAATRLRQMLARPGIVVAPGICDGISARAALEAGFTCLYQSGAATTASRLGMPDLAIATLNDFVQVLPTHSASPLYSNLTGRLHGRFP
jgi:2-methylisocitrate lyase-like PEP mutase family enzyme